MPRHTSFRNSGPSRPNCTVIHFLNFCPNIFSYFSAYFFSDLCSGKQKSKIRNLQVSYFQSYPYFTRLFLTLVFVALSAAVGVAVQAFDPSTCEIEVGRQAEL